MAFQTTWCLILGLAVILPLITPAKSQVGSFDEEEERRRNILRVGSFDEEEGRRNIPQVGSFDEEEGRRNILREEENRQALDEDKLAIEEDRRKARLDKKCRRKQFRLKNKRLCKSAEIAAETAEMPPALFVPQMVAEEPKMPPALFVHHEPEPIVEVMGGDHSKMG